MTSIISYSVRPVGFVRSQLTAREEAPKQGSEGAPQAWVEIDPALIEVLARRDCYGKRSHTWHVAPPR